MVSDLLSLLPLANADKRGQDVPTWMKDALTAAEIPFDRCHLVDSFDFVIVHHNYD